MLFINKLKCKVISILSAVIPKSERIWIFGAWEGKLYADNAKTLFEFVNKEHDGIRAVWITYDKNVLKEVRSKGYKAYCANTVMGLWNILRAGVAFETEGNCDISVHLDTKRTKVVQLWHGMGIKSVGKNSGWNKNSSSNTTSFWNKYSEWYWMVASEEAKVKYLNSFDLNNERIFITGQPKDDAFVNVKENEFISFVRQKHPGAKIAVYLPTHRNFGKDGTVDDVMSLESLRNLNLLLHEKNIVIIFKPHFHEFAKYKDYTDSLSNIVFATDKKIFGDVYTFLPVCDMLITDYSGIMFGYLASGKPIIYFPYDYDKYVSADAGFCYDYSDIVYGPVCYTWEQVVDSIINIKKSDYDFDRDRLRKRFCPYHDGNNCKRVYDTVTKLFKG